MIRTYDKKVTSSVVQLKRLATSILRVLLKIHRGKKEDSFFEGTEKVDAHNLRALITPKYSKRKSLQSITLFPCSCIMQLTFSVV
jgi:hypothetical protein